MRSDANRLADILAAARKITERISDRFELFQSAEMVQVWVIHHLQVIGEAARGLTQSVRDAHPEVSWPQIVALRNILVHEYFGLDMHQVWTMAIKDVPALEKQYVRSWRKARPPISPPEKSSRPTESFSTPGAN